MENEEDKTENKSNAYISEKSSILPPLSTCAHDDESMNDEEVQKWTEDWSHDAGIRNKILKIMPDAGEAIVSFLPVPKMAESLLEVCLADENDASKIDLKHPRSDLLAACKENLQNFHYMSNLVIGKEEILNMKKNKREEDETSSIGSSVDVFSEDEEEPGDDLDAFSNQTVVPPISGLTKIKFQGIYQNNTSVYGYLLGETAHKKATFGDEVLEPVIRNREQIIYDFPMLKPDMPSDESELAANRLEGKQVIMFKKQGFSLRTFLKQVPEYGVVLFLRHFMEQFFLGLFIIHESGYLLTDVRPRMLRIILMQGKNWKKLTVMFDVRRLMAKPASRYLELNQIPYMAAKQFLTLSGEEQNGKYNTLLEIKCCVAMFSLLEEICPFFKPPHDLQTKIDCYTNKHLTRDMYNRMSNLLMNIRNETIPLPFINQHVFFYSCREVLDFFEKSSQKVFDSPKVEDVLSLAGSFGLQSLGKEDFNWQKSMPDDIQDYINIQTDKNNDFKVEQEKKAKLAQSPAMAAYLLESVDSYPNEVNAAEYTNSVFDLLKFIRIHSKNYNMQAKKLRDALGERPRVFCDFFTRRFPGLVTATFCNSCSLKNDYYLFPNPEVLKKVTFNQLLSYEADIYLRPNSIAYKTFERDEES